MDIHRLCSFWFTAAILLMLLLSAPASGRALLTAVGNSTTAQDAESATRIIYKSQSASLLEDVPITRADWGAILGTSIGAVMLAGLWALRCCLKRSSPDHNHMFADGERPNSPLLTPRTPQSPRSEGRRSWSSSPATYTPPPVKLLTSPKPDLAQATTSGPAPTGLLFNKEQLNKARDDLSANVEGYVTTALRSRFAGVSKPWLLDGLDALSTPAGSTAEHEQLEVNWARHRLWQWLEDNMWGGADNPLVARGKVRVTGSSDGVTKTQAARELLSAIWKNSSHKAFRTAVTTFSQQLLAEMADPAQKAEPSADSAAASAAISAIIETALLFQLQMLGTSAGMQVYVPGLAADAGVPEGAMVYSGRAGSAAAAGDGVRVLCSKPGVLELRSLGGIVQSVVVLPAQAVTCQA